MTYDEKELQEKNFFRIIGYCVLFKESDSIEKYMELTDKDKQVQFIKMRIADKIGIFHNEIEINIGDIIIYANENFKGKGLC